MTSASSRADSKRFVVGVAGRIGAGKTSAAKYISSTFGFQYLRYSEVLAAWQAKDSNNKAELQTLGWDVMGGGLQSELNRKLIAQIRPDANAVVDGLRHPLDYESLITAFQSRFRLIFLDASIETRWSHVKGTGRHTTFEEFRAADSHPVEQNIEQLRVCASLTINNEGSLAELCAGVDSAIKRFEKEGSA